MNGVRNFSDYKYFCYEMLFDSVCLYFPFFSNLLKQNVRTRKGNSGVSFNIDILLNYRLSRSHKLSYLWSIPFDRTNYFNSKYFDFES